MSRIAPTTPEPIEVPERPHISDKRRLQLYLAAGGRCQKCAVKVGKGEYDIDHVEQRWIQGDDSDANLQVLCVPCHKAKSGEDAKVRKKVRGMSKLRLDHPREVSTAWRGSRPFPQARRVVKARKTGEK